MAGPVLRAGLTDVFVTGIEIRWISVRQRPIAIGAKPFGARPWVDPSMTIKKEERHHDLGDKAGQQLRNRRANVRQNHSRQTRRQQ